MKKSYEYKAFISYSHKNWLWAKWLKYRLETFTSKKHSEVKHPLREIFLDCYNLSVDDLKEKALPENLRKSKFLICLCTKYYNSEWVDFEIKEFKKFCSERGDDWKDYVIPVCIGCTEEILPESIKGIKAVTVNGVSNFLQQEHSISLIVSKILGIDNPDTIYRYLRRILYFKILVSSFLVLAALACALCAWEFSRTKYLYFSDFVEGRYVKGQEVEWIEGIGKLSPDEVDTMRECFRFEYKRIPLGEPKAGRWQLQRVMHLNAFGLPVGYEEQTTPFARYPIQSIKYMYRDSFYVPERIECFNEHGVLQKIKLI